jgi:hypothetical protein
LQNLSQEPYKKTWNRKSGKKMTCSSCLAARPRGPRGDISSSSCIGKRRWEKAQAGTGSQRQGRPGGQAAQVAMNGGGPADAGVHFFFEQLAGVHLYFSLLNMARLLLSKTFSYFLFEIERKKERIFECCVAAVIC